MIRTKLLCICVLIVPALASKNNILSHHVNCLNEVDGDIPLSCREIAIDNPSELQCEEQETAHIPARRPENVTLSWYVHDLKDGSKTPALNITWWIDMRSTLDQKGFALRFYQDSVCQLKKFDFNVSDFLGYADASRLYFNYLCYETSLSLEPENDIVVGISSLPESFTIKHSSVDDMLLLPGCEDEEMKQTKQCLEKAEILQPSKAATDSETPEINIPADRSISVGFIVGSSSAAILVVAIVLLYKTTFQSLDEFSEQMLPKVFVVNNINDKSNNDLVQNFIEDLSHLAKVDSFLRSTNSMLENGWLERKLEEAHCLVFVAPSCQADSENENTCFLQTYNCVRAQQSVLKLGVYFAQGDSSRLPRFVDKHSHSCAFIQKFKKDIILSNLTVHQSTSNCSDMTSLSGN